MKPGTTLQLLAVATLLWAGVVMADKQDAPVYRWVDDDGSLHYGDRVPPEFASIGHDLLNDQGIEIGHVEGEKTAEEKAEAARRAELLAEQLKVRDAKLLRDKVLLSTYLSVEEIEALRDRRMELVAGQIHVTQLYLDNLRAKLIKLEKEAKRFSPYSINSKARPIDEKLSRELSDTLDSIMLYEQNMARSRGEQTQLMAKFSSDIDRFRQLHRLN
jgi:hypothetical protein